MLSKEFICSDLRIGRELFHITIIKEFAVSKERTNEDISPYKRSYIFLVTHCTIKIFLRFEISLIYSNAVMHWEYKRKKNVKMLTAEFKWIGSPLKCIFFIPTWIGGTDRSNFSPLSFILSTATLYIFRVSWSEIEGALDILI